MQHRKYLLFTTLIAFLFASVVHAADHGYVTTEPNDHPEKSIFRVNIESVNGKDAEAINVRVPAGDNSIKVSLVFNPSWGSGMEKTQNRTYTRDMTLTVEKGKTYFLGARVDTRASPEAQADGSFWEPIVVESKGH